MSATIDNDLFRYYFASDHVDTILSEGNFYSKIIVAQRELQEKKKLQREEEKRRYKERESIEDEGFEDGF